MGLIDQAQEMKSPFENRTKVKASDKAPRIMQSSLLISVANDVLDLNTLPAKSKKKFSGYRTRIGDASWRLTELLGNVDEHIWSNMVGCTIEGQEKTFQHSQPNGTWKMIGYEVDIKRDKANDERLFLAAEWVDADNQQDLNYQNGAPSVNVNIASPKIPKEILSALSSKGGGDDELKGLLKDLISAMAGNLSPETERDNVPSNFDDIIPG